MPVSTPTPEMHGGNFAPRGFPTARLLERELRDNQDTSTPSGSVGGHGQVIVAGERLATDYRHPGYTVLEYAPLEPRPSAMREGRVAESGAMDIPDPSATSV